MHTLERLVLRHLMADGEPLYLSNVLGRREFDRARIPGPHNIPVDDHFVDTGDSRIVVYCANFGCSASSRAARQLEAAGYRRVFVYTGGIEDWQEAGYPVEGGD